MVHRGTRSRNRRFGREFRGSLRREAAAHTRAGIYPANITGVKRELDTQKKDNQWLPAEEEHTKTKCKQEVREALVLFAFESKDCWIQNESP